MKKMKRKLKKRFENAKAVPQILKNHAIIVETSKKLLIKKYSNDKNGNVWNL